jgi:ApaG protein
VRTPALSPKPVYEANTRGIVVQVTPDYREDQSAPEEGRYFWAYKVLISNTSDEPVQLKSRVWRITNAVGKIEEVRGPGVIGQTPTISPGQDFSYTSGCPLTTSSGFMAGSYQMLDQRGVLFDVAIPTFSLDSPFSVRTLN